MIRRSFTVIPRNHISALLFYATLIAVVLWSAIPSAPAAVAGTVRVGGSGLSLGVMKALAEAFEHSGGDTTVEVLPSLGSSGGIKALLHGALDIAASARPLNASESESGAGAVEIARTPFIFIAHREINKTGLTLAELVDIYAGRTTAWPDGSRLRLVLRPESDSVTRKLRGLSQEMDRAVTLAMTKEGMLRAVTDQESLEIVEKIPGSLAASTLLQVISENRQVNILDFNAVFPSVSAMEDGTYPVSVPLYIVTVPGVSPSAQAFMAFIASEGGRAIMADNGGMPLPFR